MKTNTKRALLALSLPLLLVADFAPEAPLRLRFVGEAAAVIGAPWTPVSYAGVARRTTRRAVVATSAATSSAAAASTSTQSGSHESAPPPEVSPAVGTVVPSLPAGCVATAKGGVEYYRCGTVYYRAAFQGNNLVYVVDNP